MVEYITGINGIGKTRVLLETAIATAEKSKGNVVFLDCSNKLNLILPQSIRLINPKDYEINTAVGLYGFLLSICASDYDLTDIFVDSVMDIFSYKDTNLNDFMDIITKASKDTGVNFHFSVNDVYERELVYESVCE